MSQGGYLRRYLEKMVELRKARETRVLSESEEGEYAGILDIIWWRMPEEDRALLGVFFSPHVTYVDVDVPIGSSIPPRKAIKIMIQNNPLKLYSEGADVKDSAR